MTAINETTCQTSEIVNDSTLSNALECARTCRAGDTPKTCYYSFTVERYPVNDAACQLCTPNVTNSICPNCQCVALDGVERMALTVNRMIPGPSIQACLGDYIVVDVLNKIKEEAITIHWHGVFQNGSQYYDGPPFVTQCPIDAGDLFRYQFHAGNSGTHFWHSHSGLQKMDGFAGTLIIREPAEQDPNSQLYDYDLSNHVIFLSDWMHEESTSRNPGRETGVVGQLPDAVLINGKGTYTDPSGNTTTTPLEVITVEAKKRYRFRMVNSFCTVCPAEFTIQNHNLTVIAVDGLPINPVEVTSIVSYPGERYDFVITTNATAGAHWIQLRARGFCATPGIQQLATLQYLNASTTPVTPQPSYNNGLPQGIVLNPAVGNCDGSDPNTICISDLNSAIRHDQNVSREPDLKYYFTVGTYGYSLEELFQPNTYSDFSVPRPGVMVIDTVNNISYEAAASPPLSQFNDIPSKQFCNLENLPPGNNTRPATCTHLIKIKKDALVQFALIDGFQVGSIQHPFHLHGHAFRVLSMGQPFGTVDNATDFITADYVRQLEANNEIEMNLKTPPGKDTLAIPNNGYVIYRFYANNPGFWLLHCHFVYHQMDGMELIVQIGELLDLPPVPSNFPKCGDFKPAIKNRHFSNC
ncbi:uncharacterized protein LOC143372966 [Andrena cerasifolii]|uniref:uncharacterized protein LOC143372966 n=1 Tax=Andrena cerasifolii TaxID=2819439 RepID=UPI0040379FAA